MTAACMNAARTEQATIVRRDPDLVEATPLEVPSLVHPLCEPQCLSWQARSRLQKRKLSPLHSHGDVCICIDIIGVSSPPPVMCAPDLLSETARRFEHQEATAFNLCIVEGRRWCVPLSALRAVVRMNRRCRRRPLTSGTLPEHKGTNAHSVGVARRRK